MREERNSFMPNSSHALHSYENMKSHPNDLWEQIRTSREEEKKMKLRAIWREIVAYFINIPAIGK